MKKFTSLMAGLAMVAGIGTAHAQATLTSAMAEVEAPLRVQRTAPVTKANFKVEESPSLNLSISQGPLMPKNTPPLSFRPKSLPKLMAFAKDLEGFYVGTYNTLTSSSFDGGGTMKITPDAEGDSITIQSFWNGCSVRAHLNSATGTVTIPSQYVMTDTNYGALNLAVAQQTGAPDYQAQITGTVAQDGTIDFSSVWWGVYVQSGENKDRFVAAYYNLVMTPPSGTMTYLTSSGQQAGYYVLISQTSKNILKVTNIFNRGMEIEIELKRDRSAEINNQTAFVNSSGTWVLIACKSFNESGALTGYSPIINISQAAAGNDTKLSWTDWSLLCAQASTYAGHLTDAELTAFTPFSYPTLSVSEFEGDGTAENPYLIKSLDHLILLADKVNTDTEMLGKYYNNEYTRTFLGKHFALANDIDMSGYRFEPIGYNWNQRFAGELDGRGHTITGLTVNGGSQFYSGLFGMCDTACVIKNIVLESPVVTSDYSAAAGLVAWMCGSIEDVTVNNPNITNLRTVSAGIGGVVLGSMKNCHVTGGRIEGAGYVGAVAGEVHGGMSNCSGTATQVFMTGSGNPGGGVVGNLLQGDGEYLAFSGLLNYYNCIEVQYLGGVAGMVQSCTLRRSFSSGVVRGYASESCVGGVAGLLTGNIEDCYSSGFVHCYSRMTGGIVGQIQKSANYSEPSVRNAYTSATVEAETYQYNRENCSEVIGKIIDTANPVLENLYFDSQVTNFYSTRFAALTSELTAAQGPKGFSADVWTFTEGAYPRIKAIADTEPAKYSASAVDMKPTDNFKKLSSNTPLTALGNTLFKFARQGRLYDEGHYARIVDNKMIEIGEEFGADTLYVINGDVQTYHVINIAPIPFEGDGTAESPFLIKTKDDLIAMSVATTLKHQTFPGQYFELCNDIDMELSEDFLGIDADNSASAASIAFQGVFDGKGHTIDRLNVANRVAWTKERTPDTPGTLNTGACKGISGLFGRVGTDGIIRNVNIGPNSKLEMYATCAAIVGQLDGRVENCRNYADVIGYSCWVGGIVGQANKGSVITDCYNAGNITTGYANVGGIVGSCVGTLTNCVNTGDITATLLVTNYAKQLQRAGGITGGSNCGSYTNCVNFGTVRADLNNAGGIAGALEGTSTAGSGFDGVENCFNFGNVYCGNLATTGAICGLKGTKTVSNVYYDVQTIGLKAGANSAIENMIPAETAQLIAGTPMEGFDAAMWDFTAGKYPVLKAFADEPKVKAARQVILSIPEGKTVADLRVDATLCPDATWSLVGGTVYSIEGNTLKAPATVDNVVTDTLVAVNASGVRRPILITAKPENPLAGEGTETAPFLIENTDDWNALAEYASKASDALTGQFVKITADLDFSDKTVNRLAADGVTAFEGTLDGDSHTLKGLTLTSKANQSVALIGTIGATGTVKNLTLEGTVNSTHTYAAPLVDKLYGKLSNIVSNVSVNTDKANAGGVAGYAYDNAAFEKVIFRGSITSPQSNIGGIVAYSASTGNISFTDCAFEGKIEQTGSYTKATAIYVGGFIANCGPATFTDCHSSGEITIANTTFTQNVAGFVAICSGNKDNPQYTFTNCYNTTAISAGGQIAGIVSGVPTAAANFRVTMTDCYNAGDITSEATATMSSKYTAGLIVQYSPGSKFIRCHNEGTLITNKVVYVGGIAGYYVGTPGSTATPDGVEFTDCWNEGLIVADGNQGGGIVSYVNGAVTLTGCYNIADIEGNQMLGGITSGFAGTGGRIINCYNTGNITAKQQRAGGLVAWGAPTDGVVQGCWNSGTIQSTSEEQNTKATSAYSVGGLAAQSGATFIDCYNVGEVRGLSQVGGLVGTPVKAKTSFTNCYNAGKITAPADSCGSIVGVATVNNGKAWTDANLITNCYYLDINTSDNDADCGAKALTRAELAALDLGDGFTSPDDYTHPLIKAFADHEVALFHAAELVLAEGDTFGSVTGAFKVGSAHKVIWTSDCPDLQFAGTDAYFTKSYTGPLTVTASCGDLQKTYELTASATSGISDLDSDGVEVVTRRWYTPAGVEVGRPEIPDGKIYIVVSTLSDGSTRVEKKANIR